MLRTVLAGILVASLATAVPAKGNVKKDVPGPKGLPFITRCLEHRDELFLTANQIRELEKLQDQYCAGTGEKGSALKKARIEYMNLMKTDSPDFARLRAKAREIADLEIAQKDLALDAYEAGHLALSDDQKARLSGLKTRKRSRHADRKAVD